MLSGACLLTALLTIGVAPPADAAAPQGTRVYAFGPVILGDQPRACRPIQMVHGFDRMLHDPQNQAGDEGNCSHLAFLSSLRIRSNVGSGDCLAGAR